MESSRYWYAVDRNKLCCHCHIVSQKVLWFWNQSVQFCESHIFGYMMMQIDWELYPNVWLPVVHVNDINVPFITYVCQLRGILIIILWPWLCFSMLDVSPSGMCIFSTDSCMHVSQLLFLSSFVWDMWMQKWGFWTQTWIEDGRIAMLEIDCLAVDSIRQRIALVL